MKQSSANIKEADLIEFYQHYYNDTLEEFRARCTKMIKESRVPNPDILRKIALMSKDQLLKTVNNFAMKGHGMGVISV